MYPVSVNAIVLLIWAILWNCADTDTTAYRLASDSLKPSSVELIYRTKRVQTPDRTLGIDAQPSSPIALVSPPPMERGHLSSTTQGDGRSRGAPISPTGGPTYVTRTHTEVSGQESQQPTQQSLDDTYTSSRPTRGFSDTVSTGTEGTGSEEVRAQTSDPAIPNLPESSITVNSLQTSFEDIKQTESQIPIPLSTEGNQKAAPSLENGLSRTTLVQSIDNTDGESSATVTSPPQILQGASKDDTAAGHSQSSVAFTITTEYRSPADPDSMVTVPKSTTGDSRTHPMTESILNQDGFILPNSMSSLPQEVFIIGGSTSAADEKIFSTGFSERLTSTTFNSLEELTHISTFGTPQRLGVDNTQTDPPDEVSASHARLRTNVTQAAPGWTMPSNYPSLAIGSVSPSRWATVSDIPVHDTANQEGSDPLPSVTDTSTSETRLGYAPHEPTTGGMAGPGTTESMELPGSEGYLANVEHTDPVYEASVSHVTKKGTVSFSMGIIIPSSCIFMLIFECIRRRNLRRRARLRTHQLRLDPTKSYFSLDTSR